MSLTLVNVVVVIQGLPAVTVPAADNSPSPVPVLPSDGSAANTKSAGLSTGAVAGGAAGGVLALGKHSLLRSHILLAGPAWLKC